MVDFSPGRVGAGDLALSGQVLSFQMTATKEGSNDAFSHPLGHSTDGLGLLI